MSGLLSVLPFRLLLGSPFAHAKGDLKMARTNKVNNNNSGVFKHRTSIGENGETLYDAPILIKDQDDMNELS